MLGNYSKFVGAIVGGTIALLVALGVLPSEWAEPENIEKLVAAVGVIVTLGSSIAVYFFPANKKDG